MKTHTPLDKAALKAGLETIADALQADPMLRPPHAKSFSVDKLKACPAQLL